MQKHLLLVALLALVFQSVHTEEKDYTDFVKAMSTAINSSRHKGWAYNRLANFSDLYGPRMWGSSILEMAIQGLYQQAKAEGFDNVKLEPVTNFTKWVRGKESLTLFSPRPFPTKLDVIGLGRSTSGTVRGNVVVVQTWDQLDDMGSKLKGKIVLFNLPWMDYDTNVDFRVRGASKAAAYGAIAVLVRSVTPISVSSVHAGTLHYDPNLPQIPAAAITLEDADMFARMQKRGQTITVELSLESQLVHGANSYNLVFELQGAVYPDQIILMGGHIDSWDTGSQTGANDDGGGFMTVFEALRLLKANGFRPKRTLRFIAWSGEEFGTEDNGAHQYVKLHANEIDKHVAVFQSDEGSRTLLGFGFSGNSTDKALIDWIAEKYLSLLTFDLITMDGEEADSEKLYELGVPMIKNVVQDTLDQEYYFTYHHTRGDSMSIMDPDQMDQNVLGIAVLTYIIADLQNTLNRT